MHTLTLLGQRGCIGDIARVLVELHRPSFILLLEQHLLHLVILRPIPEISLLRFFCISHRSIKRISIRQIMMVMIDIHVV